MHMRPPVIGIIGGECTGKTTLAVNVASALSGIYIDEQLRRWVMVHGRAPLAHEQHEVLELQIEALAAVHDAKRPTVVDTAPLMTAIYSAAYFQDDTLWAGALDASAACTHLVWCAPDFPWHPEPGMRDGEEWRTHVDFLLQERMPELALRWPVVRVEGSPESRLNQVLDALRGTS